MDNVKLSIVQELKALVQLKGVTQKKFDKALAYLETESGKEYIEEIHDYGYNISESVDCILKLC